MDLNSKSIIFFFLVFVHYTVHYFFYFCTIQNIYQGSRIEQSQCGGNSHCFPVLYNILGDDNDLGERVKNLEYSCKGGIINKIKFIIKIITYF